MHWKIGLAWPVQPCYNAEKGVWNGMEEKVLLQAIGEMITVSLQPVFERFDQIDKRLDRIEERLDRVEERLDRVEERLDRVEQRLDRLEERMDHVEQRLDRLEGRMDHVEQRLDRVEQRLDHLEEGQEEIKQVIVMNNVAIADIFTAALERTHCKIELLEK